MLNNVILFLYVTPELLNYSLFAALGTSLLLNHQYQKKGAQFYGLNEQILTTQFWWQKFI